MVVINPVQNMFWGVALDAGKRYSQTVDQTFHLSMAALEPGTATGNEYVQVMIQRESSEFLLCSLQQGKIMQQPLDLIFSAGEELSFSLVGKGTVHLTGYIVEDMPGMDEDDYSDDGESESDAPELVEMDPDMMMKPGMKRKAIESALQSKKKKFSESFDDDDEDDDDDSDDDDDDFSEDELTFDEDEDSDIGEDDDDEGDDDEEEEESAPKAKISVVTPKGDNAGKKGKQTPKTPVSQQKQNVKAPQTPNSSQKNKNRKQEGKSPQTPSTPANGESASAKKKKNKKNKDGNTSMNTSTASTPEKSSSKSTPKSAAKGKEGSTPKIATPGKKRVVAGGTVVEDVKVGHGPEAKPGKMVSVYYVGTLTSDKRRFDSCTGGKPFKFRLKKGEVIKGWDNGVEGMKVGGKRKIVVPPNQGYGNQKQGPIPANSSLSFEVELKAVS